MLRNVRAKAELSNPVLRKASEHERKLVETVRSVLTPELLPPEWLDHPHPMGGYCYVASESLYYLLGGREAGFTAKRAPCAGGARVLGWSRDWRDPMSLQVEISQAKADLARVLASKGRT